VFGIESGLGKASSAIPVGFETGISGRKGSSSFLKKRTKKLSLVSGGSGAKSVARLARVINKSFLVLFFKKELLPLGLV
jgi:hypothetical protein